MKYTINGFSQKILVDKGLDSTDANILRWIIDFRGTGRMKTIMRDDKSYFWIDYQTLLDDMPILNIKRRAIAARLQKLCDANILEFYLDKTKNGTFTYYHVVSDTLELLLSYGGGCRSNDTPAVVETTPRVSLKRQPRTSLLDNPTTKNKKGDNPIQNSSSDKKPEAVDEELATYLADCIEANDPKIFSGKSRKRSIQNWADSMRLLRKKDGRSTEEIRKVIHWCQNDKFWKSNILSGKKLREKYTALYIRCETEEKKKPAGFYDKSAWDKTGQSDDKTFEIPKEWE